MTNQTSPRLFKIRNLSYCFKKKISNNTEFLSKLNFDIYSGQFFAIVGPNGAGKTTLFNLLASEKNSIAGEIYFNNSKLDLLDNQIKAQHIAVLPQHYSLEFDFWVDEVISLGRLPHLTNAKENREIVQSVIELLDLTHLQSRKYPSLSGGEKQRVQFARVLAQVYDGENFDGKCLLLDEPTSALDLLHQHKLLSLLDILKAKGLTIIAIMHDLQMVADYSDRILMLKSGKPIYVGDTEKAFSSEKIYQTYGLETEIYSHPQTQRKILIHNAQH